MTQNVKKTKRIIMKLTNKKKPFSISRVDVQLRKYKSLISDNTYVLTLLFKVKFLSREREANFQNFDIMKCHWCFTKMRNSFLIKTKFIIIKLCYVKKIIIMDLNMLQSFISCEWFSKLIFLIIVSCTILLV